MATDPRRQKAAPKQPAPVKEREKTQSIEELLRGPVAPDVQPEVVAPAKPSKLFEKAPAQLFTGAPSKLFEKAPGKLFTESSASKLFVTPTTTVRPDLFRGKTVLGNPSLLFGKPAHKAFPSSLFGGGGKKRRGTKRMILRRVADFPKPPALTGPNRQRYYLPASEFAHCYDERWGPKDFVSLKAEVDFDNAIWSQVMQDAQTSDLSLHALGMRPDEDESMFFREQAMWDPISYEWSDIMMRFSELRAHLFADTQDVQDALDLASDNCACARVALTLGGRVSSEVPYVDEKWVMDEFDEPDPGFEHVGVAAALVDHLAWFHPAQFGDYGEQLANMMMDAAQDDKVPPAVVDIFLFDLGLTDGSEVVPGRADRPPRVGLRGSYVTLEATYYSAVGVCSPLPAPEAVIGWRLITMAPHRGKSLIHGYDVKCDCGLPDCGK